MLPFAIKMEDIQEKVSPRIWNTNYYECLNAGNIVLLNALTGLLEGMVTKMTRDN